ncbi:MAG: acetyltransferase [Candidatus Eremiobacterota bacterium]
MQVSVVSQASPPWTPARPRPAAGKPDVGDQVSLSGASRTEVVRRVPYSRGGWLELLRDRDPHFVQRNFHPRQVHRNRELIEAFGTDRPHSGDVLLHYAGDPPDGVTVRETPVLLVQGASKTGDFWWDPREDGSGRGLPQYLRERGFRVFAVTFAHNQDDQFLWSQQIANASERVRTLTGAARIDLVAHSKGGQAARMYCSSVGQDWMTPYAGDVRRLVLVAAPNGGIDYSFRHPSANYALYGDSDNPRLNAPISWDRMVAWGQMHDVKDVGFGSQGPDYWPGQRQLLARWDHRYPLNRLEPDYYTSYHGGTGLVSEGRGIQHFIQEGGSLVERLDQSPIDPSVQVAVMAGNKANIEGIVNEKAGPSDGLLLLQSAVKVPDSTNVIAQDVLPLNHKSLVYDRRGLSWIHDVLTEENPRTLSAQERQATVQPLLEVEPAPEEAPQITAAWAPMAPSGDPSSVPTTLVTLDQAAGLLACNGLVTPTPRIPFSSYGGFEGCVCGTRFA